MTYVYVLLPGFMSIENKKWGNENVTVIRPFQIQDSLHESVRHPLAIKDGPGTYEPVDVPGTSNEFPCHVDTRPYESRFDDELGVRLPFPFRDLFCVMSVVPSTDPWLNTYSVLDIVTGNPGGPFF